MTQKPEILTQQDIVTGFRDLGLARGDAVEVHSSLRSLGHVQGGASTVIQALMEVVSEAGAIVMSAYPVSLPLPLTEAEKALGITAKVRFLDVNDDPKTGMGIIADTFTKMPGTILSKGIHRVCCWGKDAHLHSQGYSYLLSINGWALLIGVDIHRCSSMHQAEGAITWPEAISASFRTPEAILEDYPKDRWYVEYYDPTGPPVVDAWGKIQDEADRLGLIRHATIGNAHCMFFRARHVVEIYEKHLRSDPYGLFGIKHPG
jgi:aminoglycoside N3'-acetyltransferase